MSGNFDVLDILEEFKDEARSFTLEELQDHIQTAADMFKDGLMSDVEFKMIRDTVSDVIEEKLDEKLRGQIDDANLDDYDRAMRGI